MSKDDELKRKLLIQEYNLKNNLCHYEDTNNIEYYYEIKSLLINKCVNDSLNLNDAKIIKVEINEDYEANFYLKNVDKQLLHIDYMQNDITKPVSLKLSVLEEYENIESGDIYKEECDYQVIPIINSNIPQGR